MDARDMISGMVNELISSHNKINEKQLYESIRRVLSDAGVDIGDPNEDYKMTHGEVVKKYRELLDKNGYICIKNSGIEGNVNEVSFQICKLVETISIRHTINLGDAAANSTIRVNQHYKKG